MDIKNNGIYNNSFLGVNKSNDKMTLTPNEENFKKVVVPKVHEFFSDMVEKQVPENGLFRKITLSFEVPDTNNIGVYSIEYDHKNPKVQRYLTLGVHHKNSDRLVSNIILKGTKQEILDYIKSHENQTKTIEMSKELSDKVDEFYS